jgi:serine/threonine protein kinase
METSLIPFYLGNDMLERLTGPYTYIGGGSFGCVFEGLFDGKNCIIKYNKIGVDSQEAAFQTGVHEAYLGQIVNKANLPAGRLNWVQTVAFGSCQGEIPAFVNAKNVSNTACFDSFDNPKAYHLLIVQESAGISLNTWMKNKTFDNAAIASILFQLLWGIQVAHGNFSVVHGDIKPDNIAVEPVKQNQVLRYGIKTKRQDAAEMDYFEIPLRKDVDVIVRFLDLGGAFIDLNGTFEKLATAHPYSKEVITTDIFDSPDKNTSHASDLYAIGMMLATLIFHKSGALVDGVEYNYVNNRKPPVSGPTRTSQPIKRKENRLTSVKQMQQFLATLKDNAFVIQRTNKGGLLLLTSLLNMDNTSRLGFGGYGANNYLFSKYFIQQGYYKGKKPMDANVILDDGHHKKGDGNTIDKFVQMMLKKHNFFNEKKMFLVQAFIPQ